MELEFIRGQMERFILANIKIIRKMDSEFINLIMDLSLKDTGPMEKQMDWELY